MYAGLPAALYVRTNTLFSPVGATVMRPATGSGSPPGTRASVATEPHPDTLLAKATRYSPVPGFVTPVEVPAFRSPKSLTTAHSVAGAAPAGPGGPGVPGEPGSPFGPVTPTLPAGPGGPAFPARVDTAAAEKS